MSRLFEQYSSQEKIDMLQMTNSGNRQTIEELREEIKELQLSIFLYREVVNKLPQKERELTVKRFRSLERKCRGERE